MIKEGCGNGEKFVSLQSDFWHLHDMMLIFKHLIINHLSFYEPVRNRFHFNSRFV